MTSEVKLAEQNSALLKNNEVCKQILPLVRYKVTPIVVASPKEHVYEQMTYNPAFTERNIQEANAYLLDSRPEQKSLVTYHTLPSLCVCVWLVNTLTSTALDLR